MRRSVAVSSVAIGAVLIAGIIASQVAGGSDDDKPAADATASSAPAPSTGAYSPAVASPAGAAGSTLAGLVVITTCPSDATGDHQSYAVTLSNHGAGSYPVSVSVSLLDPATGAVLSSIGFDGAIGSAGTHSSSFESKPDGQLLVTVTRTDTNVKNTYFAATFPCGGGVLPEGTRPA